MTRLSTKQLKKLEAQGKLKLQKQPQERKSKYKNVETEVDGIKFASKKEAKRYTHLLLMQQAHSIRDLRIQVPFILQEGYRNKEGKAILPIKYVADFVYYDIESGREVVEDVKASKYFQDDVYKLKKKLFMKIYPEYHFIETY